MSLHPDNYCLILLGRGTPADPACDHLSGTGAAAGNAQTRRHAGGFALYGGPHILTLVTEVATRALKAVRFQKFNNHIRLRPEALAQRIELVRRDGLASLDLPAALVGHVGDYLAALDGNGGGGTSTLGAIAQINTAAGGDADSYFLPMAFAEGSPMHPAYGAGHATVAGACVTILKAYFDTGTVLARTAGGGVLFKRQEATDQPVAFRAPAIPAGPAVVDPSLGLVEDNSGPFLTLEGELNKLAANISIGRNMAGVHYYSDYYDSLRLGEEIALGVLEEQALCYPADPFRMTVPTFDGDVRRVGG